MHNLRDNKAKLYENIQQCIHEAAQENLGRIEKHTTRKTNDWWNNEIATKIGGEKKAYQTWLTTHERDDRKYCSRINRDIKNDIIKIKNET